MIYFSEKLKYLRSRDGISQNALSKELETTRATVNAWEMGISYPNAQSLVDLAQYFKVSVDYLLGIDTCETVDISHLDVEQKNLVIQLVRCFDKLESC